MPRPGSEAHLPGSTNGPLVWAGSTEESLWSLGRKPEDITQVVPVSHQHRVEEELRGALSHPNLGAGCTPTLTSLPWPLMV